MHVLQSWFCLNGIAVNPDKSDAILHVLGTRQRSRTFASVCSVDVAGCSVLLSDNMKILGVTLDCHFFAAYYHIRSLRHIRSAIADDMAKSVASALVCCRLDYANSLLFATTQKNINRFRRVLNTLAGVVASHALPRGTHLFDISRICIGSQLINALNSNLPR